MSIRPLSEVQAHLGEVCREVAATGEPVEIECEGQANIILMPAPVKVADEELTRRILGGPENEKALREAVERAERGESVAMTIDELCKSVGLHGDSV
jgi:PHD/YefM family antitoxin component YafN of YafNO toxin-antitoxin module